MAEKVDQDVREAAAKLVPIFNQPKGWQERASLAILTGKWDNVQLLTTLARMKAAGRQQGLREAVAICGNLHQLPPYDTYEGHDTNSYQDTADRVKSAITALIEGEGE